MRATVLLVAALLVVGASTPAVAGNPASDAAAVTPAGEASTASAAQPAVQDEEPANDTENETAPGALLAGVVNVQEAAVEGEVEQRSFGLRIAATASNPSRTASVVAEQSQSLEARLAELRERKQSLDAALENGTISSARYRAEMAGVVARISTLRQLSNATVETARGLPADTLTEHGVDSTAIQQLQESASNLSNSAVTAITGNDTQGPTFGIPGNGDGPSFGIPEAPGEGNDSGGPGVLPGPGDPGDERDNGTTEDPIDVPGPGDDPIDVPGPGDGSDENETDDGDDVIELPGNETETPGDEPGVNPPGGDDPATTPKDGTDRDGTTTDGLLVVD